MFWDKAAPLYDLFETLYNGKVFNGTGAKVAEFVNAGDKVLECACGTGAISIFIAKKGCDLTATDFSDGMLVQAKKKCRKFSNAVFEKADITALRFEDNSFDAVVAGNVIHLLPEPDKALRELFLSKGTGKVAVKFIQKLGANFKRQFDLESYKKFFADMGVTGVEYFVVEGRMPCAIAVMGK